MTPSMPSSHGPRDAGAARESRLSRRSALELARIYVAASAYGSALEVLDRIPQRAWDEEARLVRTEALLGLGRTAEAELLLGSPVVPLKGVTPDEDVTTTWQESGEVVTTDPGLEPFTIRWAANGKARPMSRRERLAHQRFLLHLRILHRTGRYREVLRYARTFFTRREVARTPLAARIASVTAQSMQSLRRPASARALFEEILDLYEHLRSAEGVADALMGLANCQVLDCHWDEADALYQEARFRYETMGNSDKALACLVNLGVLRAKRGDLGGGRSILELARARAVQLGTPRGRATILLGLAMVAVREGKTVETRRHLLGALREARRTGSIRSRALAFEILADLCLLEGRLNRAEGVLAAGLRLAEALAPEGDLHFEILRRQAELQALRGNWSEARLTAVRAQEMAREYGDRYEVAAIDRLLSEADAVRGELRAALGRARSAKDQLNRIGETLERARLELLLIFLELRTGAVGPELALTKMDDICSPYKELPGSIIKSESLRIRREAMRLEVADTG